MNRLLAEKVAHRLGQAAPPRSGLVVILSNEAAAQMVVLRHSGLHRPRRTGSTVH